MSRRPHGRRRDAPSAPGIDDLVPPFAADVRYDRPGRDAVERRDALRAFYEFGRPLEDGRHEV